MSLFAEFAYVLEDVQAQAISFGSTVPRNTGIYGKGAPYSKIVFVARRETDTRENLGPTTYDTPTRNAFYAELSKVPQTLIRPDPASRDVPSSLIL